MSTDIKEYIKKLAVSCSGVGTIAAIAALPTTLKLIFINPL